MAIFEIKNLTFKYPTSDRLSLDNVSLTIEKGEYVALCGKSGSGKTTLLKHLKDVLTPHGEKTGEIYFDGTILNEVSFRDQSSKIGFVMQNPDNQVVTDKVWHELAFGLESLGYEQKIIRTKVAEMASYFGIQNWFHKDVKDLSGGQKQLLNLASIMAMQPSVLILDEPTSQLDPIAAADFLNTVKKINLELGTTIIITEHRLEDVFHNADKVIVMDNAKVICNDNPRNVGITLKNSNHDMFTAMPTPVQIFYELETEGRCPLTVREGRNWLTDYFKDKKVTVSKLDFNEKFKEVDSKDAAISLKEIWFRYSKNGDDIIKGISLNIPKNEIFTIVGGNGTGKSTTLKAICGINKPYRGKVLINGKDINKYKYNELFNETLAMLPQDPQSLFVKKSVKEDLAEMLTGKQLSAVDTETKILEVAKLCDVEFLLKAHPYDLSGGELQRAALAKVLLTNPKILLLDEPTKGIDNFFKTQLADILCKLKNNGVTIVMVSHDIEFCAKYSDKVSMFFDGDIITTNTPNAFFSSNSFYTTAANRMSRHVFENSVRNEDVVKLCKLNA